MATIRKRKNGSGDVVWELTHGTGSDRQRIVVGRTREEAQEALRQFDRQLALHGEAPKDDSFISVVGQYLAFLETNRRGSTHRRYERVLTTFHACFLARFHPDVRQLRQLRPVHIEDFKRRRIDGVIVESDRPETTTREEDLRQILAAGVLPQARRDNAKFGWLGRKRLRTSVTPRTINYEIKVLRTFFRWAISHNHLFLNPAAVVDCLRLPKRALPKFLTADQLKAVFDHCKDAERRLFMTILLTGMRKGEVEHLMWSDINFELGILFIQEKPDFDWKPKTDERVIPISPVLRQILLAQHEYRRSDQLVFPNKEGYRDTHILEKFKKVCKKAGVAPANVHSLRHSFGAHLRMAGVSLADIADLLGHKDLATTQIYAKVHQDHLRGVVAKLTPIVSDEAAQAAKLSAEPQDVPAPVVRGLLKH